MKIVRIVLEWIMSAFVGIAATIILSLIASESILYLIQAVLAALIVGTVVAGVFYNANAPILYGVVAGIIVFFLWYGVINWVLDNQDMDMFVGVFILSLPCIIFSYFALVIYPKIK